MSEPVAPSFSLINDFPSNSNSTSDIRSNSSNDASSFPGSDLLSPFPHEGSFVEVVDTIRLPTSSLRRSGRIHGHSRGGRDGPRIGGGDIDSSLVSKPVIL